MKRHNWKRAQPRTMCQAVEWSLEFAGEHQLNAERIAERMGLHSHWVIYKWASEGRMPAVLIPAFEHACGINLVSRWLASTGGKLLIDLPSVATATPATCRNCRPYCIPPLARCWLSTTAQQMRRPPSALSRSG